jgi:hypothetical protein
MVKVVKEGAAREEAGGVVTEMVVMREVTLEMAAAMGAVGCTPLVVLVAVAEEDTQAVKMVAAVKAAVMEGAMAVAQTAVAATTVALVEA